MGAGELYTLVILQREREFEEATTTIRYVTTDTLRRVVLEEVLLESPDGAVDYDEEEIDFIVRKLQKDHTYLENPSFVIIVAPKPPELEVRFDNALNAAMEAFTEATPGGIPAPIYTNLKTGLHAAIRRWLQARVYSTKEAMRG